MLFRSELLFTLRKVDAKELVARASVGLPLPKAPGRGKVLDEAKIAGIFGIELAEITDEAVSKKPPTRKKSAAKKKALTRKKKILPAKKKTKKKAA